MLAVTPPEAVMAARRPAPRFQRTCAECGVGYRASARHGEFCGTPCRKAFNNRRMVRGAELYDLVMALRHDRKVATAFKVWKLICRLCQGFREEDVGLRAGRHSWRHPREIIERRPYLRAEVMEHAKRGKVQ